MSEEHATPVAQAVLRWFRESSVCRKKHPVASEWTVLAGFVVRVPGETATYRALACGTGTKCLGRRDLRADGLVVNDCHAEVVARRALLRYLYSEARAWSAAESAESPAEPSIFERAEATGRLRLKPDHELHLFVSETPCGDASIYPLQEDVVDALVQQRQARARDGDVTARSELRLTGAKDRQRNKRPSDAPCEPSLKRFQQDLGIARTKSGRSDLPAEKQTLSMSCSDKIAKWVAFGVQGTLLRRVFEPLRLSSVVVSHDSCSRSERAQRAAITRALVSRLGSLCPAGANAPTVHVEAAARFEGRRRPGVPPSPLSLNWTASEGHWQQPRGKNASSSTDVEVLMAATGLRQGAKKAAKLDRQHLLKVASRLCKWRLVEAFVAITPSRADDATYQDSKNRVRRELVPTWDDDWRRFIQAVGSWVGVPASYKTFSLPSVSQSLSTAAGAGTDASAL
ncbi:hypothetical protein ATCC90586_009789 [Pythium insidiosum]|nr:hypothetical protein ATCC90586_009789 [Pythium insidiosum]